MINFPKRKLNRLPDHDYSNDGIYFVTICSKYRQNIFSIINHAVGTGLAPVRDPIDMKLTDLGIIINKHWLNIPNQNINIDIDQYIIMPNHIHGIIIINKRTGASPVPTLSKIIGSFKSKSSIEYLRFIKQNNLNLFGQIWQRSFHDHVIRDEKSLNKIREYIVNNPINWESDKNNMEIINHR